MAAVMEVSPVSDYRISSVVPATASGEHQDYELGNMDLAMKTHYIKAVYFFQPEAAQGLTCHDFKKSLFPLLDFYPKISGRIRKRENCRPFLKCNDAGVRIVEANCDLTLQEWLGCNGFSLQDSLAYGNAIGPDLSFSPLVFIQLTWFKCRGLCVGICWAHLLGDAFSVSAFINHLGRMMSGHHHMPLLPKIESPDFPPSVNYVKNPTSAKRVHTVGDCWMTWSCSKMKSHSFYVSGKKIDQIVSSMGFGIIHDQIQNSSKFEILSAVVWKSVSKIREEEDELGTATVTICTPSLKRNPQGCSNDMMLSTIEADFRVAKSDISDLVRLIADKKVVENGSVEELVKKHEGKEDFIVYGANLTFVDLEGIDIYGLEFKGRKPTLANYSLDGVGDEGAVLVLPAPDMEKHSGGGFGRLVTVILGEKQMERLKIQLGNEWDIA